jgi:hypothetical protein
MATEPRLEILANALAQAAQAQGVVRVDDLDFKALAAAVDAVTRAPVDAAVVTPLDPEGDGLTPREINAANDG